MENLHKYLKISPAVQKALDEGRPVLALESTIISHGMPYPQNLETARLCEAEARKHGVEPATVAIIHGKLCAGLTDEELEYLAKAGPKVAKASRRDLPILAARGADGATTVAATMIVAAMAGIRVFATGGIGGVHRGAEVTMDISADLEELEYLETKGVPVLGYRTETLPAFYTDESDFKVDYRMDSPMEIAAAITAQRDMGYPGGMLITNPIPHQYAMPKDVIDAAINQALAEAKEQGIKGKATTPFLLARVCELTGGESLKSNIKLVLNNVALGAQIAAAMH